MKGKQTIELSTAQGKLRDIVAWPTKSFAEYFCDFAIRYQKSPDGDYVDHGRLILDGNPSYFEFEGGFPEDWEIFSMAIFARFDLRKVAINFNISDRANDCYIASSNYLCDFSLMEELSGQTIPQGYFGVGKSFFVK